MRENPVPRRPWFPNGYGFGPDTRHRPQFWESIVEQIEQDTFYKQVTEAYSHKYDGDEIYPEIEAVFLLECKQLFFWLEQHFHGTATKWVYEDKKAKG